MWKEIGRIKRVKKRHPHGANPVTEMQKRLSITVIACFQLQMSLYLGLDCSTQSFKAIVVDEWLRTVDIAFVHYASDLSEYGTTDGYIKDGTKVVTPTIMFLHAFELVLQRLKAKGNVEFSKICAISGSGQQHGSVWWKKGASDILQWNADEQMAQFPLQELFQEAFSSKNGPIWMDSSTSKECEEIEAFVGGPEKVAELTGSRCYERFTGPQIRKYLKEQPLMCKNTERISLISSFLPSILIGAYVGIDYADGSGMNLMDIYSKEWSSTLIEATTFGSILTADELRSLLGKLVSSDSVLGKISPYFQQRFGFSEDCQIVSFSGDNINALAAMNLHDTGDIGMSLGTSDTVFAVLNAPKPNLIGHVFRHPLVNSNCMALLCFKNGSLAREKVRNACARMTCRSLFLINRWKLGKI